MLITAKIPAKTIKAAKQAVRDFAKEDQMPRCEYMSAIRTLDGLDDDWFMVADAIGTRGGDFISSDPWLVLLYEYATIMWYTPIAKKAAHNKVAVRA